MHIGIIGALQILFIGLKLTEIIDWSWGWVLSPMWMPVTLIIAVGLLSGILSVIRGGM